MGKKILLFLLVGLCVWNLTKLPYYVAFDPADATDEYARHGLEGSINLGHWVEGYHGTKLKRVRRSISWPCTTSSASPC